MSQTASLFQNALMLSLWTALPFVLAALIGALVFGIIRASMQIDDDAITFTGKLLAVSLAVWAFGVSAWGSISDFTMRLWGGADLFY